MREDHNGCYSGLSTFIVKSGRGDSKQVAKGHCSGNYRKQKTLSCPRRHTSHIPSFIDPDTILERSRRAEWECENGRDGASLLREAEHRLKAYLKGCVDRLHCHFPTNQLTRKGRSVINKTVKP